MMIAEHDAATMTGMPMSRAMSRVSAAVATARAASPTRSRPTGSDVTVVMPMPATRKTPMTTAVARESASDAMRNDAT